MSNDPSNLWDPPEYLAISERRFLQDRAGTLHAIQKASYLAMAQVLIQVQEKFKDDPKLDGWFLRWVDEATPLNRDLCARLLAIGRAVKEEPEFAELTRTYTHSATAIVARLPPKARKKVTEELLQYEETLTSAQLQALSNTPEVELETAEQLVQQLQTTIANAQLRCATAGSAADRGNAKATANKAQQRLQIALARLTEARQKVTELEQANQSQSRLEEVLRAQIRAQQLKLEEASLDPEAKRKRAVAKTLVDASNGLDLLLSSLDKYEVDRADLGEEATKALERKMALVHHKLRLLDLTPN